MCLILVTILVALQFPSVLHTPWAALVFSVVTTATIGTISAFVGGPVASLPIFALILVNHQMLFERLSARKSFNHVNYLSLGHPHYDANFMASFFSSGLLAVRCPSYK